MRTTVLLVLAIVLLCTTPTMAQSTTAYGKMSDSIILLVNQYRATLGKPKLVYHKALEAQALVHSKNMANNKVPFGHQGFEQRADKLYKQVANARTMGENVAYGPVTAKRVVDNWINSPKHRENIEGDFKYIGVGIAKAANGTLYYTQLFTGVN